MSENSVHLAERLRNEGTKTLEFFNDWPAEGWSITLYTDGTIWAIRDLLAHLVSTERSFHILIEDILAGGPGAPEEFNIDAFNAREVASLAEVAPEVLLQQFNELRQRLVKRVATMNETDLMKTGRHPFLGQVSLTDIIKMVYRHHQLHLRDARQRLP